MYVAHPEIAKDGTRIRGARLVGQRESHPPVHILELPDGTRYETRETLTLVAKPPLAA